MIEDRSSTITPILRTDAEWVADISATGEQSELAVTDLRQILLAGLARAFRQCSPPVVEDSVQEALILITKRIQSYRGDSRFTTWALSIATHVTLSEMRRSRWSDVSLDQMVEAGQIPASATGAQVDHAHAQLMGVVQSAIENNLTEKQRQAIRAELSGAPTDEIAKRLGTSRNALYKVVYDARVRLKQAILGSGWTEAHVLEVLGGGR
jgi:RNA polymerase sigma-70 factor (ECF subfamily)